MDFKILLMGVMLLTIIIMGIIGDFKKPKPYSLEDIELKLENFFKGDKK